MDKGIFNNQSIRKFRIYTYTTRSFLREKVKRKPKLEEQTNRLDELIEIIIKNFAPSTKIYFDATWLRYARIQF